MEVHPDSFGEEWTNQVKLKVRVLLADDKIQMIQLCCGAGGKALDISE
jgi:hypothetical protein